MKLYRHIDKNVDARRKVTKSYWDYQRNNPAYWLEDDEGHWHAWMGNQWEWRAEWPREEEKWVDTTESYITVTNTPVSHYPYYKLTNPVESYKESSDIEFVLDTGINFRETFGTYYCRGYQHHKTGKTVYGYFKEKPKAKIHNEI